MDKLLTNYQQDIVYYVVLDDEDDIYMKFVNHGEALEYYSWISEVYANTNKTFYLTQVKHTVLIKDSTNKFNISADKVAWFD